MADRTLMLAAALVAASAGLVIYMSSRTGTREQPPAQPQAAVARAEPTGVRPADYDPAIRTLPDRDDDEPPAPPVLPAIQPVVEPPPDDPGRGGPPPEPPPPVVLSDEEKAAQDALFALREAVADDVRRQLDKQSNALRRACWKPELTGGASSGTFGVNASFDASGALLAYGISDSRDGAPAGVGACLRQQALALAPQAPGQPVSVDVQLRLP